ncbi:MAG: hypothetical protein WDA20_00120 [Desulfuromonadales bacterium]
MNAEIVLSHLTFALAIFLLLPICQRPATRVAVLAGAAILTLMPIDGLSLAEYGRSLTSDLSITTLLWLAWCAGARIVGVRAMPERQHLQLALCFGALALLLYPAALGLTRFDPYRLGYSPQLLLVFIFAISLGFWLLRHYFAAALLTAATGFYLLGLGAPSNYWDYLIDGVLGLYCWAVLGWCGLRWVWRNLKPRPAEDLIPEKAPALENSRQSPAYFQLGELPLHGRNEDHRALPQLSRPKSCHGFIGKKNRGR